MTIFLLAEKHFNFNCSSTSLSELKKLGELRELKAEYN